MAKLDALVFGGTSHDAPYSLPTLRQFFDLFPDLLVVAVASGGAIGYGLGGRASQRDLGWLLSVAVEASYRKTGIGSWLVREVIDRLSLVGVTEIRASVHPDNAPSRRTLQACGLVEFTLEHAYFGSDSPRIIVARSLTAADESG